MTRPKPQIDRIAILDDLSCQHTQAIEVEIYLNNGERRWCWFTIPKALNTYGNWIAGTKIPFHHSSPHMIVIASELTENLIHAALNDIAENEDICFATLPCD